MDPLLELSPTAGAQKVVLEALGQARRAAGRLRLQSDPQALHAFRTGLRRTRSLLRAYRPALGPGARKHLRALGEVAELTGQGRDAEVLLGWLSQVAPSAEVTKLRRRLGRERDLGYALAQEQALGRFFKVERALRLWLGRCRGPLGASSEATFARYTALVLRDLAEGLLWRLVEVESEDDQRALHRGRLWAKRLRYVLEPLRTVLEDALPLLAQLKELQDDLGALHDLQQLEASASGAPGVRRFARREHLRRFGLLRRGWLDGGLVALVAEVDALALALEAGRVAPSDTEIERKYLLSGLPPHARTGRPEELWQGYIPGQKLQERLRRVKGEGGERYYRTVKLGRGISRVEVEEETPRALFLRMWPLTAGKRVRKRRWAVEEGGFTWEVDQFLDRDLVLAEVELPSEDARPKLPGWLARYVVREVTLEDRYVNVNLAR